jgi:hypothetical protein
MVAVIQPGLSVPAEGSLDVDEVLNTNGRLIHCLCATSSVRCTSDGSGRLTRSLLR